METRYYEDERLLVFKINEEIDECSVKDIRRRADYEIEMYMPKEIIFDFDCVNFMDSAGIGMLIGRYKQASLIGGRTKITNLSENVRKIFEMSGILKIIPEIDFDAKLNFSNAKGNLDVLDTKVNMTEEENKEVAGL